MRPAALRAKSSTGCAPLFGFRCWSPRPPSSPATMSVAGELLRGSAAQGLAAISTRCGAWTASGAPSATTVPPTSVPRQGSAPPVDGRGGSGGAGAREVAPRGSPSLHEGSGHGQPEQRRREGRPAPAVPMAVLFRRDGLQPVAAHLTTGPSLPQQGGSSCVASYFRQCHVCRAGVVRWVCILHKKAIRSVGSSLVEVHSLISKSDPWFPPLSLGTPGSAIASRGACGCGRRAPAPRAHPPQRLRATGAHSPRRRDDE